MRDRYAIWFQVGLLSLLAMLTFWLERTVQAPQPKNDGSSRHDPDYTVENFTATRMGLDGLPRHTLTAAKMVHYPDDDTTHLEKPHFTRLEKDRPPLHIQSDRGLLSSEGEHAYFTGNVLVTREATQDKSALTLTTSYLHVIPDQDRALTDKPVNIRNAHTNVNAVGLELNNQTHVMKLLSRVKGEYEKPKR
ncbi:MAG: LPS export ABC transporter periplasmic protein LptC [Sulfuricella sp.]|nr:LPS export ABC transporter periplasmic protein LptC [Gammaproteobacteria bacterium]